MQHIKENLSLSFLSVGSLKRRKNALVDGSLLTRKLSKKVKVPLESLPPTYQMKNHPTPGWRSACLGKSQINRY